MKKAQLIFCLMICALSLIACGNKSAPAATIAPTQDVTEIIASEITASAAAVETIADEIGISATEQNVVGETKLELPAEKKTISSVQIQDLPAKVSYFVKEKFSAEGGTLLVTYEDGTTTVLPMTAPGVEIAEPSTARTGAKNVSVTYGGKKVSFKVKIAVKGMTVTFRLNDDANSTIEQNVTKGYTALAETPGAREGYTFENWYADEACTVLFDFDSIIEADTVVYAKWLDNGTEYHHVVFDVNYLGCAKTEYPQLVADGSRAVVPAITPERVDYRFCGWFLDADGENAFDAGNAIYADTTVYACWEKTKSGVSLYVFEAEDVDLSQKAGPGYSGENAGIGMIVTNKTVGASGDKFVAYQCKNGNSLEFNVVSDVDTEDAILYVTLAAEFSSMRLTPDTYEISVNGMPLNYGSIDLELPDSAQQSDFADFSMGKISLKKGANLIRLKTTNNDALGGTLTATAPIIDCIKIETADVVIWDGTCGLPQSNY